MEVVNFEGLGLSFNINNVLININGFKIYWYAVFIVVGIILSIILCKKDDGKYNIRFDDILTLIIFLIPISIISARIYYVIFKLDSYIQNPIEILNIRNGGLAIYGGIIGAIITIIVFCKKKKIKVLDMLDFFAPYLALSQSIGRWGNFFNIEAYGTETNNILRMGIIENGKYIQVHPTFLYESICTFIIFIILYLKRNKREYSGQLTYIYFALYGLSRALIEGFRTDSLMLGGLRVSQIVSIVLSIIFITILIFKKLKKVKIKYFIVGFTIIIIDQLSKFLIIDKTIIVIPNLLKFTYTQNKGAAFGIGKGYIVLLASIIIILGLIIIMVKKRKKITNYIPYVLIISGSIGNLIDRIFRGYVVDFIDVNVFNFPIFNIADISIVIGLAFLLLSACMHLKKI